MPLSARSLAQARVSAADLGGRPAPPDNQSGPSGTVTDSSDGGNGVPSDSAADGLLGGAQAVDTPDVAATSEVFLLKLPNGTIYAAVTASADGSFCFCNKTGNFG